MEASTNRALDGLGTYVPVDKIVLYTDICTRGPGQQGFLSKGSYNSGLQRSSLR